MEDIELIEKYFRKELTPEESIQFTERLVDPTFKRKFETESLLHKAIQFSHARAVVNTYAVAPVAVRPAAQGQDNRVIAIAGTALAVWIVSTFSSSATNLSPQYIKWIGVILSLAAAFILMFSAKKTMNTRAVMAGVFNGLLIFIIASGLDAINQGARGIADKKVAEAQLVPFTEHHPWWPTQSLEDSLAVNKQRLLEMGEQIKGLISSRLSTGPNFNFGLMSGKFTPVVIARSSTVQSGATYEADIFLATSPLRQTLVMRVDSNPVLLEADPSGVQKGKVSFKASAEKFDNGMAKKTLAVEIQVGDSTYRRVVEYSVLKPK